ncbi:hypothetical protein BC835DRAFT_1388535 [Cytidiella melzeri]|nr:hypothetical protein BC835DRAFT_1388535 [Cytidiella melzeri]
MNSTSSPDVPVSEATLLILAPMFTGALVAFLLFGISIMQLFIYSLSTHRDHLAIRITVYVVFLFDIFQSVVVAAQSWYAVGSGWGRPLALLELNWTFEAIPAITGIVAACVQIFYAWRIYRFSQWRIIPAFIVAVALMQCSAALSITAGIPPLQDVTELHILYRRTIVWLGGAAAVDVTIAATMLYLLFSARRNMFGHTQRIINRLIRLTVETGVVTATCALMELIMFQVLPATNMHLFFSSLLAKVYFNALMTSLNSRRTADRMTDTEHSSGGFAVGGRPPEVASSLRFATSSKLSDRVRFSPFSSFTAGPTAVVETTVVHVTRDQEVGDRHGELKAIDMSDDMHRQNSIPLTRISEGFVEY